MGARDTMWHTPVRGAPLRLYAFHIRISLSSKQHTRVLCIEIFGTFVLLSGLFANVRVSQAAHSLLLSDSFSIGNH